MIQFKTFCSLFSLLLAVTPMSGCAAQGTQINQSPAIQSSGSQTQTNESVPDNQTASAQVTATHPAMTDPTLANKTAPEKFQVKFSTTKGDFTVEVVRAWSPNGADRFYNMVDIGYYNDTAIFRAIQGFMFQFGIHGDPAVNDVWSESNINDDPAVGISNLPGHISFAKLGSPNSRSTQLFINLGDNSQLDHMGFTPFGKVVEGMDVVTKINTEYGENENSVQSNFQLNGNDYILKKYPNLDLIRSVTLIEE